MVNLTGISLKLFALVRVCSRLDKSYITLPGLGFPMLIQTIMVWLHFLNSELDALVTQKLSILSACRAVADGGQISFF